VLISFLDESYTQDRYYIAAFVIGSKDLALLNAAVADAARYAEGFGVPPGAELHAHEIMSGKGSWAALRGQHRSAIAIYQRALTNIAMLPGIMCVRGVTSRASALGTGTPTLRTGSCCSTFSKR
jgi:hypothetical protein